MILASLLNLVSAGSGCGQLMNQPGRSDLLDIVNQRVQQPLNANLRPAPQREPSHALGGGDVGKDRLDNTHTSGVHPPPPFGVDPLAHLLGIGPHRTIATEEPTPGRGADQTTGGEIARTAAGPL